MEYICVVGYTLNERTKSRKAVKSEYFVSIISPYEQTQFLNFLGGVEGVRGEEVGVGVSQRWCQIELQIFTVYCNLIAALWFRCIEQPGSTSYSIKAIFFVLTCEIVDFFQSDVIRKKNRKATLEEKSCS